MAKFAVLAIFVALATLAQSVPQFPLPYGQHGIPHPGYPEYNPGVHYSYDSQYLDPVTGEVKGEVSVRRGAGSVDIQADPIRALGPRGIPPTGFNPLLGRASPYGAAPYNYPGQYNYPGLGYRGQLGYPGYY